MLLIFDLDGTLFQAKSVILLAARRLPGELGMPVPDDDTILKNAGQGIDAILRNILPDSMEPAAIKMRFHDLMHEAILDRGELFPGVSEMISQLCSEGHTLVIISNSSEEYIETVLEHTGITNAFSHYYSVNAFFSKTDLVGKLIKPGVQALVIGDTHGDIEAAHGNGLEAIAAMYGYGNKSMLAVAEYFAESPEDIIECVRRAGERGVRS